MLKTIILAGGQGTRMKSKLPKVLQCVNEKYLLAHVIDTAINAGSKVNVVVVGHKGDLVKEKINEMYDDIDFVYQKEQNGTAHAVMMAKDYLDDSDILVLCGDTPLLNDETIKQFIVSHKNDNNAVSGISIILDNPKGYGRIKRENGKFSKIVEQKDCSSEDDAIKEVNTGVYLFNGEKLKVTLDKIKPNNAQNELYLTDALEILKNENEKVEMYTFDNEEEFLGINDKVQLANAEAIFRDIINEKMMRDGVIIKDPKTTYISKDAKISPDTVILPNTTISGKTVILEDCIIGPNTVLKDMTIGNNVTIEQSKCISSKIDDNTVVGPFAYIRPNCDIGKNVKIGDFVEVKNTTIGDNTKASHLTYIGDSVLGKNINLGCGTITVNYDGVNKFKTVIEDDVFVGCNSNLVAPVTLKEGSYVACGSTITKDVPEDTLAIARARQEIKANWKRFKK